MIKILLAEDHKIVRDGIKSLLKDEPNISVVAEARNGKEAIEKLSETDVNIAILDINMPGMTGIETAKYIKENFDDTKTMILSMMDDENYLINSFDAGAKGYLLKSTGREELLFAIHQVSCGEYYVSADLAYSLIRTIRDNKNNDISKKEKISIDFSDREMQVLELMAEGYTNAEIADRICASRRTVETHRKNLIDKTSSKNTASLIRFAITNRIIAC